MATATTKTYEAVYTAPIVGDGGVTDITIGNQVSLGDINTVYHDARYRALILAYLVNIWDKVCVGATPQLIETITVLPGYSYHEPGVPFGMVTLDFLASSFLGGTSYGGMGYANYGLVSFYDENEYSEPVQWLNEPGTRFQSKVGKAKGIEFWLNKNVTATAKFYKIVGSSSIDFIDNFGPPFPVNMLNGLGP